MDTPRVFVSYSWSSPEHVTWIIELAERLTQDGVEVVIDQWDLKEGQDKHSFMETMVTDPTVSSVLVVSDSRYASRADSREGGVGTESQIISQEVYGSVSQEKFIPIVAEHEFDGNPCLPTFLKSRIYLDFSSPQAFEENYEKLLRNLFGKPLQKRPPIGNPPSYVLEEEPLQNLTGAKVRRLRLASERDERGLSGAFVDYVDAFFAVLQAERITQESVKSAKIDDLVMGSVERVEPYMSEWYDTLRHLCRYGSLAAVFDRLRAFLEKCATLLGWPPDVSTWAEEWGDNVSFLVRELFLLTATALVEEEEFDSLGMLLTRPYFVRSRPGEGAYRGFSVFDTYQRSLEEVRNRRLNLNRLSVVADLTKSRTLARGGDFNRVIDVETLLLIRSVLDEFTSGDADSITSYWYPRTLVFRDRHPAWEYAVRLQSRSFFERFKPVLGVESIEELVGAAASVPEAQPIVQMGFTRLTPRGAVGMLSVDQIGRLL